MGQQEYEAFKAKLREWMNTHPDEYAAFEEAMNARDYAGCQLVMFQAMSLIPRYRHLMSDKANATALRSPYIRTPTARPNPAPHLSRLHTVPDLHQ